MRRIFIGIIVVGAVLLGGLAYMQLQARPSVIETAETANTIEVTL
jgi:hypothetical protein